MAARAKNPPPILRWALVGAGLGLVVLIAAVATRKTKEEPVPRATAPMIRAEAPPAAPVDPNDLGVEDRTRADPSALLGKARTRALAWSKEAVLVGLKTGPVVGGEVNLASGGTIEFVFAKPTGQGFGADTRVAGKALRIRVQGSGTTTDETSIATGRAALEPNCPLDEAARKAQAAGIPSTAPLTVSYEVSPKHQKAVWRLGVEGDASKIRLVDGNSCAIIVR